MVFSRILLLVAVTLLLTPFYLVVLLFFFPLRLNLGPYLVKYYSRLCLWISGVYIDEIKNYSIFSKKRKNLIVVSNHTTFLDIFILSCLFGTTFLSKAEVLYYPIIGQMAWLIGVVFLNRGSSSARLKVLKKIARTDAGQVIAVFPQGTTGSIRDRLHFKRGIFKVIDLNPDLALLPVTIYYRDDNEIAWRKPFSIVQHARVIFARKSIHVKVIVHPLISKDQMKDKSASEICELAEKTVLGVLRDDYE